MERKENWENRSKDAKIMEFTVDVSKLKGNGDFHCPKCGKLISPDDKDEENYSVIDSKVKADNLTEVNLRCNRCKSKIKLIGFLPLK